MLLLPDKGNTKVLRSVVLLFRSNFFLILSRCDGFKNYLKSWFFFNRHCNPCGLWPDQLSLSILSRKVFTECCCQWHVKPPTWRTSDLERSTLRHKVSPASETTQANPSSGRWNYGREIAENFAESGDFHVPFGFFYMP